VRPSEDRWCRSAPAVGFLLEGIDARVFDAAMLDMNMNGDTSHSVAEALIARGVPFIYCSGNNNPKFKDINHDRPILKKPFKHEELAKMLTRLLNP
jgi:hypothetical protein